MDTPSLLVPLIAGVVIIVVPRLLIQSVGRTSDGIAQLFVPPDRTLGWPRGVQESDEPWAWREPVAAPTTEVTDLTEPADLVATGDVAVIDDTEAWHLVVPVHAVRPRRHH